jgi:hypothetical protein
VYRYWVRHWKTDLRGAIVSDIVDRLVARSRIEGANMPHGAGMFQLLDDAATHIAVLENAAVSVGEFYAGGVRYDAGEYIIKRVGPVKPDPTF